MWDTEEVARQKSCYREDRHSDTSVLALSRTDEAGRVEGSDLARVPGVPVLDFSFCLCD